MSGTRSEIEIPETGLVPETPAAEPPARTLSPRDELMARIAEKRERQIEAEVAQWGERNPPQDDAGAQHAATRVANPSLGEVEEDRVYSGPYAEPDESGASDTTPPGRAAPERTQEAAGEKPNASAAAAPAAPIHQATTYPIEINGQSIYVTLDQALHLARMGAITNEALYHYNQQPQPEQPPVQRREIEQHRPAVAEDRIRETIKAIQYGDEASAATALSGLISDVVRGVPQVNVPEIEERAARRARTEHQAATVMQQSTAIVRDEYADIAADPIRADAAARQLAMLRQQNIALGSQYSEFDLVREAGNRVRAAFGTQPPVQPTPGQPQAAAQPQQQNLVVRRSVADIDGRKSQAPRRTAAVIDRRSAAPEAPRAPTGSDIVEQMRKSRNQTSMR